MEEAVQEQMKRKLESQVEPMEDGIHVTEEQCRTLLDGGQGKDVVLPECAPMNGVEQHTSGATYEWSNNKRAEASTSTATEATSPTAATTVNGNDG